MSYILLKVVAYISCISLVFSIIIFNTDKFITDTQFENIKNAATTRNMKCNMKNEHFQLHQHHQMCIIKSEMVYAKEEDIYCKGDGSYEVGARFGVKINDQPVKKHEKFNK